MQSMKSSNSSSGLLVDLSQQANMSHMQSQVTSDPVRFAECQKSENNININREEQYCQEHLLVKDIVCLTEQQSICSHCALFGKHHGHTLKPMGEAMKQQSALLEQHSKLLDINTQEHTRQHEMRQEVQSWFLAQKTNIKKELADYFLSLQ